MKCACTPVYTGSHTSPGWGVFQVKRTDASPGPSMRMAHLRNALRGWHPPGVQQVTHPFHKRLAARQPCSPGDSLVWQLLCQQTCPGLEVSPSKMSCLCFLSFLNSLLAWASPTLLKISLKSSRFSQKPGIFYQHATFQQNK